MHVGLNGRAFPAGNRLLLALAALFLLLASPLLAAPKFPALTGRVTDAAGILPADAAAALDTRLAALETATKTQLVVATVPDLQGYEIDEYGYQLGRAWGIGQKGQNNGVLLIVAPNERKVRIEVGYGLEGTLTDAVTSQIIRRDIVPRFKAGDMAGGVTAGADALVALLQLPPEEQAKLAVSAAQQQRGGGGDKPNVLAALFWVAIILLWMFFAVARGKRGRRSGPVILWGPGPGSWGGGGGGGWGGGGFGGGGGGFGGGGGSFGGGGSSGSW
ncbi:MAG: methanol dehydrogenase [Alphaproteobacteria bacterium PA4]|nr:MAG: methanol dehydrogenase [Alphaproteobacteria bacterium PA4]